MRTVSAALLMTTLVIEAQGQVDWPVYGHDPGGMRYSPLKQINPSNVSKLQPVWSYDTLAPVEQSPAAGPSGGSADRPGATRRPPRMRRSSTTPLVIAGVMYM